MRRLFLLILLILPLLFVVSQHSTATSVIRVDETKTKLTFNQKPFQLSLALENATGNTVKAQVQFEILDPLNKIVAQSKQDVAVQAGASSLSIPIELFKKGETAPKDFFWYRLRYKVETDVSQMLEGILSFSEITPDIFALQATGVDLVYKGMQYKIHVRAFHPFTKKGFGNVQISSEIRLTKDDAENDTPQTLKSASITDENGYTTLNFTFPTDFNFDDADITITGKRGQFTQTLTDDVHSDNTSFCFIQTDKPIYQPGQTLHIRALVRNGMLQNFLPDTEGTLTITDPEGTLLFRTPIKTSRFGIASLDWKIPDNVRLGEFRIRVDLTNISGEGYRYFTISRYELPNFTVKAKPDRTYYSPNQNAKVEVRADYLFGQPVMNGNVRVVRETDREWNYREQKWETKEEEVYEGKTDASGKFTADISLKEKHEELKEEDYSRFIDFNYVAYFTDSTTNRTESRRFDLRVTKQPIHVYYVGENYDRSSKLPLQFYITAFYADGTPAVCNVELSEVDSDEVEAKTVRFIQTVRTNRYGVAKVSSSKFRSKEDSDFYLRLTARDSLKRVGFTTEQIHFNEEPAIRVSTDKTIYRTGEPLKVEIISSEKTGVILVNVWQNLQTFYSTRIQIQNGRASLTIPYKPEFKGNLAINAYSNFNKDEFRSFERTIVYPKQTELQITTKTKSDTYRPGEAAKFDFNILNANGKAIETTLGVVVFDKAVTERTRTDRISSWNNSGFLSGWLLDGNNDSLGVVRRRDLDFLDLSKPIPRDYELAIEAMLNQNDRGYVGEIGDEYESNNQSKIFSETIKLQLTPFEFALKNNYSTSGEYPRDENSLREILSKNNISFDLLRDPWGITYRAEFSVDKTEDVIKLISAGADKKFGTDDDFTASLLGWNYFKPLGSKIDSLVANYHKRTGKFIRDKETLLSELQNADIDSNELIDRWGVPYYFDFSVNKNNYVITINSSGADKIRSVSHLYNSWDDFAIWSNSIYYFAEIRDAIQNALNKEFQETKRFPQNEADFRAVLRKNGIDFNSLRDGWGNNYYVTFPVETRYTDSTITRSVKQDDGKSIQLTEIVPVTQYVAHVIVRSIGEDRKKGTYDDFNAEDFSRIIVEQRRDSEKSDEPLENPLLKYQAILSSDKGAISGTVTDPNGTAIPGATVSVKNINTNVEITVITNEEGGFIVSQLTEGVYETRITAQGFKVYVLTSMQIKAGNVIQLTITLSYGQTTETVNVAASAPEVATSGNQFSISGQRSQSFVKSKPRFGEYGNVTVVTKSGSLSSTPRLREYFPETLFWQPEIITDSQGRAQIVFKLADNITTWNLAVVGTTLDGQIGTTQKEIRAFQPFFAEHDPPKNLTVGDEISLPVVIRNYTAKRQAVDVEIKPESWFSLLSQTNRKSFVNAGDSNKVVFPFRALDFGKGLKQRVTVQGIDANDAIERTVDVSPDGQQVFDVVGSILNDSLSLETNIPQNAIPKTSHTELKIYPNLMAHVIESVEAIMSRPYGCAEQTISAAYPSVLVLNAQKRGDKIPDDVIVKARKYAREGYERLIGYKTEDGGFTYWGRGESDAALTAYALRFFIEAKEVIDIDEDVLEETRYWFTRRQNKDGSWTTLNNESEFQKRRQFLTTAYITRVLASSTHIAFNNESYTKEKTDDLNTVINRALDFLRPKVEEFDEPYLIAIYALAAKDSNKNEEVLRAVARLEKLSRNEGIGSYWSLETNTPFYGWGQAGRIETTALVLQALMQVSNNSALINRGLLFLLKQKDSYGVWCSTQATINVLDALITLLRDDKNETPKSNTNLAEIFVDGKLVTSIKLPNTPALFSVDLSDFIGAGSHRIEIKRNDKTPASVQLVTSYYLPWKENNASQVSANDLRFNMTYDKTETKIGDEINCRVEAERIGFKGYGMMLAEIGLPPGADIDRASLEKAIAESGYAFSHYDILPDRIIIYLWAKAGGVKFNFKFKPRYGIKAQTASSQLYDYYNPEARVVIAPTLFTIR